MEDDPQSKFPSSPVANSLSMVTVILVVIGLCLSPIITLRLFHPDGATIKWPITFEALLELQISQLEPLMLSFAVLLYTLVHRNLSSKILCVASVVVLHLLVAFILIAIRGEGGLRWLN